jgi:glycine cleavage system H protein
VILDAVPVREPVDLQQPITAERRIRERTFLSRSDCMSKYRLDPDARYAKSHEWVRMQDGVAIVGISDAAQDMLSDVVYVELPEEGATLTAGKQAAVVESVKAAEEVLAPLSGRVVEVNNGLADRPEEVNGDPYGSWFFKLEPSGDVEAELAALMDSDAYDKFVDETAH